VVASQNYSQKTGGIVYYIIGVPQKHTKYFQKIVNEMGLDIGKEKNSCVSGVMLWKE
jgi:hypothetical protein